MAEPRAEGGARRILIIEDDLQIRTILERYLSAKGFGVLTAADGLEGIRRFSTERPDIVLLDVLLPKLLGSDVCDMVKRSIEGAAVPVVMMSAVMKPETLQRDLRGKKRPDAFLVKPFQFAEMLRILTALLDVPHPPPEVEDATETLEILDDSGEGLYGLAEAGLELPSISQPEPAPWPSVEDLAPMPESAPPPDGTAPQPTSTSGLHAQPKPRIVSKTVEEPAAPLTGGAEFASFLDDLKQEITDEAESGATSAPPAAADAELAELERGLGVMTPKEAAPGLRPSTFPELLVFLYRRMFSGLLVLERDGGRKEIYFLNGYPVHVRSSYRGESLAPSLVRLGRITEEGYQQAIRYIEEHHKSPAEALVELGLVPAHELPPILRELQRDNLLRCFGWDGATYELERGAERVASVPVFEMDPVGIVVQGVVAVSTEAELTTELQGRALEYVRPTAEFARLYPQIAPFLPVGELEPVLDGTRSVGELVDIAGREHRGAMLHSLKVMLVLGMIELKLAASPAQTSRPEPASAWPAPDVNGGLQEGDPELESKILTTYLRMKEENLFELLCLPMAAGDEEIERAYAERAEEFHPDRLQALPGAELRNKGKEIFLAVGYAYDVLRDPTRRSQYIASLWSEPQVTETDSAEEEFQRGQAFAQRGELANAQECYLRAVRQNPQEPEYYRELGWVLYQNHRLSGEEPMVVRAVNLIRKAIALSPTDDRAFYYLGFIYLEKNQPAVASKLLERALRHNPGNADAARVLQTLRR